MNQNKGLKRITDLKELFPVPQQDQWLHLAKKELDGQKSISDLYWYLEEEITLNPAGGYSETPPELLLSDQRWDLAETYWWPLSPHDRKDITTYTVDEIMLRVPAEHLLLVNDLQLLHSRISLLIDDFDHNMIENIPPWVSFVKISPLDPDTQRLLALQARFDWRYISANPLAAPSDQIIQIGMQLIQFLRDDQKEAMRKGRYRIYLEITDHYLAEIAKIRALKMVLLNIWKIVGIPTPLVPLIYCKPTLQSSDDPNLNLVRITTQSMAAVIGGIDVLYFEKDLTSQWSAEYVRLNRNVHYILKYESHFDHRIDPLAGSFIIDNAAKKLAHKAWEKIRGNG